MQRKRSSSSSRDLTSLPPVPKFSDKTVDVPVEKELLDLGKTVAIGPAARKMVVLPEERYLEGMSKIIRREYFPDIAILEAEEAYLEAVEQEDLVGAQAAAERLQRTLIEGAVEGQPSLEEFKAVTTSEDNASFEQLAEKESKVKRAKFERVFGGPMLLKDTPDRRLLLMPSKADPALLNYEKSRHYKSTIAANTGFRKRPELMSELGPEGQSLESVYAEIMQRHFKSNDNDDARSVSTSRSSRFEMVPTTPIIRPGVDSTPLMTWGNVGGTPQRLPPTPGPDSRARSTALKRVIKAAVGSKKKDAPFGFETRSLRANKATDGMVKAMQSPIIPRTPRGTPDSQTDPKATPERPPPRHCK